MPRRPCVSEVAEQVITVKVETGQVSVMTLVETYILYIYTWWFAPFRGDLKGQPVSTDSNFDDTGERVEAYTSDFNIIW